MHILMKLTRESSQNLLCEISIQIREKRLSPRRAPRRSLLPLSLKRTRVRLKSLLYLVWLRQIYSEATVGLSCKSAVCGLNGHRSNFVKALSLGAYEHAIWKSRSFTALFSWTLALRFIKPRFEIDAEKSAHTPLNFGVPDKLRQIWVSSFESTSYRGS